MATDDGASESSTATETIKCYGPVISKDATGTYYERHEWAVEKTVSPAEQSGFAGDTLPFTWTITVTESVFEENFDVTGTITVQNPAPMAMTVALADVLSDSTAVVIGAYTNDATYADGNLTIPANTTTVCGYTASDLAYTDNAAAPTGNTATATLNDIAFVATDPIEWAVNVIRGEAELTDLQGPLSETITGSGTWTVVDSYTCSTDTTKYTENYSYSETVWNTAKVRNPRTDRDACAPGNPLRYRRAGARRRVPAHGRRVPRGPTAHYAGAPAAGASAPRRGGDRGHDRDRGHADRSAHGAPGDPRRRGHRGPGVNMIPRVLHAPPGLYAMSDLPVPAAMLGAE